VDGRPEPLLGRAGACPCDRGGPDPWAHHDGGGKARESTISALGIIPTALASDPSIAPVVMVGEGRPSTALLAGISKDVVGRPGPVLGRPLGPTRGPTMTGEAKPESRPFRPLV